MLDHWQATSTGISTYFMYCHGSWYHFNKLNWGSEIFNVSDIFWEEIFTKFDRIAAQPYFKSVAGVQDIEYTIDPTLQRWHVWSLERIELGNFRTTVAFANSPRSKNWKLECGVLPTKSVSLMIFKEPIKFLMHLIKHKFSMHRHKTARTEG